MYELGFTALKKKFAVANFFSHSVSCSLGKSSVYRDNQWKYVRFAGEDNFLVYVALFGALGKITLFVYTSCLT
jgi:hypothetical protein